MKTRQKQTKQGHQGVGQLGSLKGYLFFHGGVISLLIFWWLEKSWLALLALGIWGVRLFLTRQLFLWYSCLFLGSLFSVYFANIAIDSHQLSQSAIEEKGEFQLKVAGDGLTLAANHIKIAGVLVSSDEKIVGSYSLPPSTQVADWIPFLGQAHILTVQGELVPASVPRNLGAFDYRQYLRQQGVYRQLKIKTVITVKERSHTSIVSVIKTLRGKLIRQMMTMFPEKVGSYLKSLILGLKDEAFKESQPQLAQLGILHFFSLSGLHVYFFLTMIVGLLVRLTATERLRFYASLLFLLFFAVLTGFTTSVGRSVFYIGLVLANDHYQWRLSRLDCWSISLMINLAFAPYLLFTAAGQLSFGLTWVIIFLIPLIKKIVSPMMVTPLFAFLIAVFSIPITSYHFYEWQVSGLVLSLILLPVFSYFLLPMLVAVLGLSYLGLSSLLIEWLDQVIQSGEAVLFKLNSLSFLHVRTGVIPLALYLLLLGLMVVILIKWGKTQKIPFFWLLVMVLLPSCMKYFNPQGVIAFVDVGQGSALVIKAPFNRGVVVVDTGGRESFNKEPEKGAKQLSQSHFNLLPFLKYLGVSTVDQVFITHGHLDHYGELGELATYFKVTEVVTPVGTEAKPDFKRLILQLQDKGVGYHEVLAGGQWHYPNFSLLSLFPIHPGTGENDDSLVLKVNIKDTTFLLMGDLEEAGERGIVSTGVDLKADVLGVGHHGSKTSSHPFFLKKVQPRDAVISSGLTNRYGHPSASTLTHLARQGATVYRTDQQGMIYYTWHAMSSNLSKGKYFMKDR